MAMRAPLDSEDEWGGPNPITQMYVCMFVCLYVCLPVCLSVSVCLPTAGQRDQTPKKLAVANPSTRRVVGRIQIAPQINGLQAPRPFAGTFR